MGAFVGLAGKALKAVLKIALFCGLAWFLIPFGVWLATELITGKYLDEILSLVNRDFSANGYYTQMAAGWLLAECFVTFPQRIWEFLTDKENLRLDAVSYKKAINKICESLTPDKEVKEMMRKI